MAHGEMVKMQYVANVQQREKFANDPQKFIESEIDLDESVKALNVC